MSAPKSKPHAVARHYKPALVSSSAGRREVMIQSFLTKGDIIELIKIENTDSLDDAFFHPVRKEIQQEGPYHGKYAEQLGLFLVASRRISHETNDVLYRHTGPKKNSRGEIIYDMYGKATYFPRAYTLRLVSEEERGMDKEQRNAHRKRVLNTIAFILHRDEKSRNASKGGAPVVSPPRGFSPTKFNVPKIGWDLTPEEPLPLDWYITDQMVQNAIYSIYVEQEIGRWDMFAENVPEADCFFSPPYSHVAFAFGFRNPDQPSAWVSARRPGNEPPAEPEQAFDAEDVLPLA